jgi:uncharacterized membrane protein YukC
MHPNIQTTAISSNKPALTKTFKTMSYLKNVVTILSTKYGFDATEAVEYVKTQKTAVSKLTKEEKAALKQTAKEEKIKAKVQEKEAKALEKANKKAERAAKKAEKESKPKKPRTEAQLAAFEKMKAANKAKQDAKLAAASENVVIKDTI